ncbi:oligopeptide/dipeptide ABC transporter, ATP-binding protein, C-terminal domain protein [Archaeoglobus sulfaticallidus PM70-1]|uniref:Nickel import system ATP-binding protein NikD n=1 Tax=Archaeoglobus sulfaticallidus PM70-1 TaxID=387631 RepID=N0B9Z6_9EURY|nr:ABC transporter ATP-binding protein [Archaeoglobus sulfaticallidus]AGK60414.1 oligopeptide/dipeptide ABC transporter, ATP-binding protein, C-terminal domain protein [Archaeoglobus sulfaticallidus PM70-1]
MKSKVLEVRDLTVHFYTYAGIVKAIEKVSFDVYMGETFALVGETGCGKSVTARALTQLIESPGRIVGGEVYYTSDKGRVDLLKLSEEEIRKIRGSEIAYIFQDPQSSLDPLYTIGYQISEALYVHKRVENLKDGIKKAVEILRTVLMPDPEKRVSNYPHEMSGGMKQRATIGIGISNNPKLLIADEPTTALDVTVQTQILDLIKDMKERYGATVILITHDMGVVAGMADRVGVMYAGKIVELGDVYAIFKKPLHPYTQGLLRAVPNPLVKIERLETIPGTVPSLINPPEGCRFSPRCPLASSICREKTPELVELEDGHFVACHNVG